MSENYITCNICEGTGKDPNDLTGKLVCWKCHGEGHYYTHPVTFVSEPNTAAEDAANGVNLEQILRQANTRLDEILADRDKAKAEIERLRAEVEDLQAANVTLTTKNRALTDAVLPLERENADLKERAEQAEAETEAIKNAVVDAVNNNSGYPNLVFQLTEIVKTK